MTETAVAPTVEQWLEGFADALEQGDAAAAAERFLDDSYWRDLVAFTWNLKTVEGPDAIRDMLEHTLAHTRPRAWRGTQPPARGEGGAEAGAGGETQGGGG